MNILLDTCTFLWIGSDADRLSEPALASYEDPTNTVFFSAISAWEINLKWKKNRLPFVESPDAFIQKNIAMHQLKILPFSVEAAMLLQNLTLHHNDPHDHMLICQAHVHHLTVLTPDEEFQKYDVEVVW